MAVEDLPPQRERPLRVDHRRGQVSCALDAMPVAEPKNLCRDVLLHKAREVQALQSVQVMTRPRVTRNGDRACRVTKMP